MRIGTLAVVVCLIFVCKSGYAIADDCPRGTLDPRYCDTDGDLIADLPEVSSQWIDPDTLIFAYTPVEDPAVYREVWSEFLDHLSNTTGKRVVFFPVQSNAAQIEAMRSGRLHVAGFNAGSTPLAVNCSGFSPFTAMNTIFQPSSTFMTLFSPNSLFRGL